MVASLFLIAMDLSHIRGMGAASDGSSDQGDDRTVICQEVASILSLLCMNICSVISYATSKICGISEPSEIAECAS